MITSLLIRLFVPDYKNPGKPSVRLSYGIMTGAVGIAVNLLLFAVKLTVGLIAGSIAIAADAVNNLSDAGSSIITLVGFKLSSRPADSGHPFGHGRMEYIAGVVVSIIILAVGFDFLKESVVRIFSPVSVHAGGIVLAIVTGTMLLKGWLFFFYRKIGKTIDSEVIRAAAFDSLSDMFGTAIVLGAVAASGYTDFPVDGCAGALVAVVLLIGGIRVLRDTINPLLGECPDSDLVEKLKNRLLACKGIRGVHDIILHNYGPNQYFATAHAEVSLEGSLLEVHDMLEAAEVDVAKNLPIHLLLHCDPYDIASPVVKEWRVRMENAAAEFDEKFKLYDFRMTEKCLHFHLLIPRNYKFSHAEISEALTEKMRVYDPELKLNIEFINSFV